ncbi:hypothetical protein [Propionicicella superfundia]|uniref:hypothetical protein n=1 Tax=Propionicicella superfundia TaxID=348582 RepID=UPI00048BB3BB|nr:hypothetical protein [Propionicicella superfundia]
MRQRASTSPRGLWRLTFRILRGAGARDRVRLALQVAGVALAVMCGMLAVTMPLVFEAERQRVADRYPIWSQADRAGEPTATGLVLGMTDDLYRGQPLSVWKVAQTGAAVHLPPGISGLPQDGHMLLSPRLYEARDRDPSLQRRLPGIVDGVIAPDGLASPDELFAWVGSADATGDPVAGFGVSQEAVRGIVPGDGSLALVELVILVGLPIVGLLVAASRMSSGTRMRRIATLRLIGLPVEECQKLHGRELAVIAAVGATAGCVAYHPLSAVLGASGLLGMSWFGADTQLWPPVLALIVAGLTTAGRAVGRASVGRTLAEPVPRRGGAPWPRWVFSVVMLAAAGCVGVLGWTWFGLRVAGPAAGLARQCATLGAWLLLAAAAATMASQVSYRWGAWLSGRDLGAPALTLGLRLGRTRPPGTALSLLSVGLMIVIAGLSTALTGSIVFLSSGSGGPATVSVVARGLETGQQRALMGLLSSPEYPGYALVPAALSGRTGDDSWATVMVGTCASAEAIAQVTLDCEDGPVLLATTDEPIGLTPGEDLTVQVAGGATAVVSVPTRVIRSDGVGFSMTVLVPPEQAAWISDVETADLTFVVPPEGETYDGLLTTIAGVAPSAAVDTVVGDSQTRRLWQQQKSLLRTFTIAGFAFCLLALCLLGYSMSQDQVRSLTALQLVGLTPGRVRQAVSISKAFAVAVATGAMAGVTGLGGQALVAVLGLGGELLPALWGQALLCAAAGTLLSALMGAALVGPLNLAEPDARE